jgi:HNH endonuclease
MDAHHITNRNEMPNGGYVLENGITLCPQCHIIAELCMKIDMIPYPDHWPSVLYRLINSSKEKAYARDSR